MLTIKIWHIGHYSSEEWFGHHDTKLSIRKCDDRDTYRDDDEKEEKKEKKEDKKDEKKNKSGIQGHFIEGQGKARHLK